MKLCYLIPSLSIGGAERQLLHLVREISKEHPTTVITFYDGGEFKQDYSELKTIKLLCLNKRSNRDLSILRKLSHILRQESIDILHTYLNSTHSIGILAALAAGTAIKVVSIRDAELNCSRWGPRVYFQTDRVLSNLFADKIIANSEAGKVFYSRSGYKLSKMVVIPNGIDIDKFNPGQRDSSALRKEFNLSPNARVAGMIARVDPVKDHQTFLEAAVLVLKRFPDTVFMVVGDGDKSYEEKLKRMILDLGIHAQVRFTGPRTDVPELLNLMDLVALPSLSEGFSNSITEAMAAGKPVVATDVGDMSRIVLEGECGFLIPKRSPEILAQRICTCLADPHHSGLMGLKGQQRIEACFSIPKMVERTQEVYQTLYETRYGNKPF